MALRLAFDLDGVLADMESELTRQAEVVFGETFVRKLRETPAAPVPSDAEAATSEDAPQDETAPPLASLNLTPRQERKLWRHVESIENFWQGLTETEPGVVARLATLADERRWEILFLTKRPKTAGPTPQVQTQRWLQAKGFPLPSVYVVQGSRGRIAAALDLDIVVDDRPENCLDVVVDSSARAILVWRGSRTQIPSAAGRVGIGVVRSTHECLDVLTQVGDDNGTDESVMTRVLRRLGLKERATA